MSLTEKLITPTGFPNFLAPDEEKNKPEFGLKVAKAIEYEWFYRNNGTSCTYYGKRDEYHKLRLYARGEQSTKIYKDLINGGSDKSFTNYDWRPLQIAPKFVKLIVNQMLERLYEVKAEAVDKYSTDLKDSYRQYVEEQVIAKPIYDLANEELGVNIAPEQDENFPRSKEEIDLHMQLEYKPAIEIATEEALKFTLDLNDYDEIQSKVIEDIVNIGIGGVRHFTDPNKGIVVKYVDPSNIVYSYPRNRDFKDVYYYGEVNRITINELKRLSNGELTDEELEEINVSAGQWFNYHNSNEHYDSGANSNGEIGSKMVDVLHFNYKATNTISYKQKHYKNGSYKLTRKESTFDKKNADDSGYDVVKKTIDVWYEGTYILGTNKILGYKLCENMVRPKGNLNRTMPNYIIYSPDIYQNRTHSLLGRMVPYIDQMQQIHIKLQQMIAKARPNGIFIDVDGLNEIDMGDGNILTPMALLKIYDDTGNVIGSSTTAEGDYNYGKKPIEELRNGVVEGVDRLINAYNHYLNLLRDSIGIPAGADASMPHPDTLVGVQQQVALNSNAATRHILDSSLNITKNLARALSLRLSDIFEYSDLKEVYISALGKLNYKALESIKNYHLHDLGINIELKPDAQEKQTLETNIGHALSSQSITLDDAIDIRSINNVKLANEVLKVRRSRREKEKHQRDKELATINSQGAAEATKIAAEAKLEELNLATQGKIAAINAEAEAKTKLINVEKDAKMELMQKEFDFNLILKGYATEDAMMLEKFKENERNNRIDKQSTNTSKIAEQKQTNSPAINFESSNDHVGGDMGLGAFEPS